MGNSYNCIQNEHDSCDSIIKTEISASEIAMHTGLKQRGVLRRALDSLNARGLLRHTDDRIERYYLVHAG